MKNHQLQSALKSVVVLVLTLGIVSGLATVLSVGAADEGKASGGEARPYEMIVPLEPIMEQVDAVFYDMKSLLKKEKFKDIAKSALFVAEMGNLFTHAKEYRGNKQWLGYLETMKKDSLKLSEAAKAKDAAKVKSTWEAVEQTCDTCHAEIRDK